MCNSITIQYIKVKYMNIRGGKSMVYAVWNTLNCDIYAFAPTGGICGRWHRNPFHTERPQLLREGCEQWEETRWDHSHADRGRCRDSRMHGVTGGWIRITVANSRRN